MPAILLLFLWLLMPQTGGNSEELSQKYEARYPSPSGKVVYQVSGDASGVSTLLWDRYGWRTLELRKVTRTQYGVSQQEHQWKLVDGDLQYQVDLLSKKGSKSRDQTFGDLMSYKSAKESFAAIWQNQTGKMLRKDSIKGIAVSVWKFKKGSLKELWEYQGVPLKMKYEYPGYSFEYQATEADFAYLPPAIEFDIPDDLSWD